MIHNHSKKFSRKNIFYAYAFWKILKTLVISAGTFHYYISIERKFHKESNFFVEKKFRPFNFEKIVLGEVSLYGLETPIRKFCFTTPLGIKTLHPSSSVDMGWPVMYNFSSQRDERTQDNVPMYLWYNTLKTRWQISDHNVYNARSDDAPFYYGKNSFKM